MKKIISILTALVLLVIPFSGITASAAVPEDPYPVMPAFAYISNAGCTLYITESGKASFNSNINGYPEVLMIEISVRLQRKIGNTWTDIAGNDTMFYDNFGYCDGTYYLVDRGLYRTETTFTVYTEDDLETIVSHSSEIVY